VDRTAQGRCAGGQHGGGVELVIGAGEEHQGERLLIHRWDLDQGAAGSVRTGSRGRRRPRRHRGGGQVGHAGETAAHDAGHLVAGDDHVGVGQAIEHLPSVALGLDQAGGTHHREMLRRVRLGDVELASEPVDLTGPLGEQVQDGDAQRVRQRPADLGLELVDGVHGHSIDACAPAHECPPASIRGRSARRARALRTRPIRPAAWRSRGRSRGPREPPPGAPRPGRRRG